MPAAKPILRATSLSKTDRQR